MVMALWRRSLSEDKADRLNHTVSVLFLLVLALVTWLVTLSPALQPAAPTPAPKRVTRSARQPSPAVQRGFQEARYAASCWCPSEFTSAHVAYVNGLCGGAFNQIIRGENNTITGLYRIRDDLPVPLDTEESVFKPKFKKVSISSQQQRDMKEEKGKEKKEEDVEQEEKDAMPEVNEADVQEAKRRRDEALYFMRMTTPFTLFLGAVVIWLPYLVWSLLSGLTPLNLDQTLAAATAVHNLDPDHRGRLLADVASAVHRANGACTWASSALYLVVKVMACVVALVLVVTYGSLLPRATRLEQDLQPMAPHAVARRGDANIHHVAKRATVTGEDDEVREVAVVGDTEVLLCDAGIRFLQNVQSYTLQCVFNKEDRPEGVISAPSAAATQVPLSEQQQQQQQQQEEEVDWSGLAPWQMYVALYRVIHVYLTGLAGVNIISAVLWLVRLVCRPCCRGIAGPAEQGQGLALDAVLLLQMAKENVPAHVTAALGQHLAGAGSKDKAGDAIPLQE